MKPSELRTFLTHIIRQSLANPSKPLPAIAIHGAPGIGKSQIVAQAAAACNLPCVVKNLADEDPGVFGGLTFPMGDTTVRLKPDWYPSVPSVLFFDEYLQAPQLLQNITAPLINVGDRILAQKWPLPPGSMVFLAMNRRQDRAATHEMPEHIKNRCIHIELVEDVNDFIAHGDTIGMNEIIMLFMKFKPALLHMHDPKKSGNTARDMAYPTPRSWQFLNSMMETGLFDLPPSIHTEVITGIIGEGAQSEFLAFMTQFRELSAKYHPDKIIAAPTTHAIPSEMEASITHTLMGILGRISNARNFDAVVTYLMRLPPEFAITGINNAIAKTPTLKETPAYIRWATAHPSTTKTASDFEEAATPATKKRR